MRQEGNITIFGQHDEGTLEQIRRAVLNEHVKSAVLCADGHLGYAVPIGGVVAYRDAISPSGVGFDISCGNCAILTDASAKEVRSNIANIMDEVWRVVSFGVGRKNNEKVEAEMMDDSEAWQALPGHIRGLKDLAISQLGTVGSGNHYVDIFVDEQDRVWIGVHFGSRGFGHKTATYFLNAAGAKDGMQVDPCVIGKDSALFDDYINSMTMAGRYAYAGREWVCGRVAKILGANTLDMVHNHHNFAFKEIHNGESVWVVRKGATPAFPGQRGFVGGSMGDISVIIEGAENNAGALYSTVHGAGRVMGRMEAKGKIDRKTGEVKRAPKITQEMMDEWVKREHVELRGAGVDEAPQAYKRLPDVLKEHEGTIKILHTLTPIGVAMSSPDEKDPYKD